MKVSIVTINRNNASGLERTARSVAAQLGRMAKDHELEYIVVDGMSTDGSLENIPDELNPVILKASPQGVYNAINVGLCRGGGDIVGLLHSGDVYADDDVARGIADFFVSRPDVDFVWGDVSIGKRMYSGRDFTPKALVTGFAPPHPSLYMRRRVLNKIGKYDETYKTAADFEYFVRLFSDTSLKGEYIPVVMVDMQPGGASQKWVNRLITNNVERLRALKSHGLPASRLKLLAHYKHIIKGYLCSWKK